MYLLFYLEDGTYFRICAEQQFRPKVFVFTCTTHSVPYCNLSCHTSCKQWHPGAARWEHGCGHLKALFRILISNLLVWLLTKKMSLSVICELHRVISSKRWAKGSDSWYVISHPPPHPDSAPMSAAWDLCSDSIATCVRAHSRKAQRKNWFRNAVAAYLTYHRRMTVAEESFKSFISR